MDIAVAGSQNLNEVAGFEQVYLSYRALVVEVAAWKLAGLPQEDVEEVVSSVWVKLLSNNAAALRGFEGRNGASLATWLSRVVKNAAADRLRARQGRFIPLIEEGEARADARNGEFPRDPSPSPLERLLVREGRKQVLLAVRGLPKIYRAVVLARYYRRLSASSTAVRLGIAEETVYVRLARAFSKLRRKLGRGGFAP